MDPTNPPNENERRDFRPIWPRVFAKLGREVGEKTFKKYFAPIRCLSESPDQVELALPNQFILEWVVNSYRSFIEETVRLVTGQDTKVAFAVDVGSRLPPQPVDTYTRRVPRNSDPSLRLDVRKKADSQHQPKNGALNRKFTFDNFVCGDNNQFAQAACKAVADRPGHSYNPLFIFGGTGLGKTHLLHAIGLELQRRHPEWNIVVLSAETFTNAVVTAIRDHRTDGLRRDYRERPDALLVDDIQFLAGKDRTQDEFFHTFNSLHDSGRQIVVTCDKFANEIPGLEERLASRLEWGLTVDVQPPDLETRLAILAKKAQIEGISLPDDVSMFLATHVKRNVRELEGALTRVVAFSSLTREEMSVDMARAVLRNQIASTTRPPDVDQIIRLVASRFNVSVAAISSSQRSKHVVRPRQVSMYLVRELTSLSYPDIGRRFGGKDHTTVMSACRKISSLIDSDASLRQTVESLARQLSI